MTLQSALLASLEAFAEITSDPTNLIYDKLFAARPEFKELFIMDIDGGVRGSTLQSCFDCILYYAEGHPDRTRLELEAAQLSHDGYGVEPEEIGLMFELIHEICRETLRVTWSEEMTASWAAFLEHVAECIPQPTT